MLLRAGAFLFIILLLAAVAFRALVQFDVQRVMSVHVIDKTRHLIETLEDDPDLLARLGTGDLSHEGARAFLAIARATHVATMFFYDRQGRIILRASADPSSANGFVYGGGLSRVVTGGEGNGAALAPGQTVKAPLRDTGAGRLHDGAKARREALVDQALNAMAAPDVSDLRALVEGRKTEVVFLAPLEVEGAGLIHFARTVLPMHDENGRVIGFLGLVLDVSPIHKSHADGVELFGLLFMIAGSVLFGWPALAFRMQKRLADKSIRSAQYLARHDALTGLLNRSAFGVSAQKWMREERGGHIAYMDVDRFKLINDTYGHNVGDAFLGRIATLLRGHFGPDAIVARLGGDEFTIVVPHKTRRDLEPELHELLQAIAEEVQIDGLTLSASVSMGVTRIRVNDTLEMVLQRADTALYVAKHAGRNRAEFFTDDMGRQAARRRHLETRLRGALEGQEFRLYYQPLVDAQSEQCVGYEALLRLDDVNGDAIPPDEFVPVAEEVGLIEEIGIWGLFTATREIAQLDDVSRVSVNLSAEQFRSGRLVGCVYRALEEAGLPAARLELEITESILMEDSAHTAEQIEALQAMGVSLAMDDFGTGFSSLSTLWKYRFDRIKIDRSFVHALETPSANSRQLIDAIVLLGERMGMSITAEGIETEAQRELLKGLGCNILQGFFFGRPQPIEDLTQKAAMKERARG